MAVMPADRAVGDVGNSPRPTQIDQAVTEIPLVKQIAVILHRRDQGEVERLLQLRGTDVGQPEIADLACLLQLDQRFQRAAEIYLGIDGVQLVQADAIGL